MRGLAALTLLLALAPVAGTSAAAPSTCAGLDAEAILVRVRDLFRSDARPPYVVYTLARHEFIGGLPSAEDTYVLRIWYRTADGAALTRRVDGGRADGPLVFQQPRFNAALDPGPPTADIFEPAPPNAALATPAPKNNDGLKQIGLVRAHVELDYQALLVSCSAKLADVKLEPRREPDRNRLREIWVNPATWSVERFLATDRLYIGQTDMWYPDSFDGALDTVDGLPVIRTIHAAAQSSEGVEESRYAFDGIEFPATLPDWYFTPSKYRANIAQAPTW